MLDGPHIEHFLIRGTQPTALSGRPIDSLLFRDNSAFALTESGKAFAELRLDAGVADREEAFSIPAGLFVPGRLLPHYNRQDRILTWGEHVVKRFRQPVKERRAFP
jgi:hypothetical protein